MPPATRSSAPRGVRFLPRRMQRNNPTFTAKLSADGNKFLSITFLSDSMETSNHVQVDAQIAIDGCRGEAERGRIDGGLRRMTMSVLTFANGQFKKPMMESLEKAVKQQGPDHQGHSTSASCIPAGSNKI